MYNFNARIKKLKKELGDLPPKVKITYKDGTEKILNNDGAAINACMSGKALKVECLGKNDGSRWIEILQALIDTDINELWTDGGDEPI